MDAAHHWSQEFGLVKPGCSSSSSSMEELMMLSSSTSSAITATRTPQLMERRTRPHKEQVLHCPRCNSTNTKFCYYNNYSLTQPRYFCKTCRRYWTEGGSLRNVPVGGGSRKNKKSNATTNTITSTTAATTNTNTSNATTSSSSHSSSLGSIKKLPHELTTNHNQIMNHSFHEGQQDLNLAFYNNSSSINASACPLVPATMQEAAAATMYPAMGFGLQGFRPGILNPPVDAHMQEGGGGRLLLPFENLTQISPAFLQNRGEGPDYSSGYWNGVMGGGATW